MDTLMGRYRNVSILAAAIFLQIVGLAVQVKRRSENQSTRLIRVWTVAAITPLEKNIVRLQTGASDIWHNYLYLRGVRQQNRELQDQIQQLQLEQVRLHQDAQQARRLQALLGFKEQFIDKTTAAQVIGSSGSEQSRIVYLDKGSADGLAQDMAVISAQGVVGKVIQVFRHTAQVLLINDQNSGVGTILEQSRLQGVLKGKNTGELVLDKIMPEEEVKAGDRVLTSGGDQIFPKGLPVGTVSNVSRGTEFLVVTVTPAASLNHLEEVLVITKKQERDPGLSAAAPVRAADILAQRLPSVPDAPAQSATASAQAGKTSSATPALTPQPKAATPVTATSANRTPGQNALTVTSATKPQAPVGVPKAQPVDFVSTTPVAGKPGESADPLSTRADRVSQSGTALNATKPNTPTTPLSAPPKAANASGTAVQNPNLSAPARVTNKTGAAAPASSAAQKSPANQQSLKTPPGPASPKPIKNTAQPAKPSGDAPQ
jgi:rod shape-determining protein MreC